MLNNLSEQEIKVVDEILNRRVSSIYLTTQPDAIRMIELYIKARKKIIIRVVDYQNEIQLLKSVQAFGCACNWFTKEIGDEVRRYKGSNTK